MSSGVGVERTFPINSPKIAYVEVMRKGRVRRAKLTFLRGMVGQYRIKERGQNKANPLFLFIICKSF